MGTGERWLPDLATIREAHALLESGRTIGKVVVEGWP